RTPPAPRQPGDFNQLLEASEELTLLPMYAPEFVATLADDQLQALVPRWEKLRAEAREDTSRLTADLFLQAAYQKLGRKKEREEAAARIRDNPERERYLPKGVAGWVEEVRQYPAQIDAVRQLNSGL